MPSSIHISSLNPIHKGSGLPYMSEPDWVHSPHGHNGRVESLPDGGYHFQWCPSDSKENWKQNGNRDYDDGMFYTVNKHCFRADDFESTKHSVKTKIMCAGDSYTFGIGVKDEHTYPHLLAKHFDAVNWNIGAGGIGNDAIALMISQFFREGYIPDVLVVNWGYLHRKILAVTESIIQDNNFPCKDTLPTGAQSEYNELCERLLNEYNSDHPDQNLDGTEVAIWQPQATIPNDKPNINSVFNAHEHMIVRGGDTLFIDFAIQQQLVSALCKAHGVKLYEMFNDDVLYYFIIKYLAPTGQWSGDIPFRCRSVEVDLARDNGHFGSKTLANIANHLIEKLTPIL